MVDSVSANGSGTTSEESGKAKEAVGETVEMEDGSKEVFAGKRRILKSSVIDGDDVTVRVAFRNGKVRKFHIPADLVSRFAAHGAEQKLGDEVAGMGKEGQDESIILDDMYEAVNDLASRLEDENVPANERWNVKREAGGFAGTSILMKALIEVSGKSEDAIRTFLKGKSQGDKLAMRASPKLAPVVERLEKERVAKAANVDTSKLFAELDAAA
jgi:hypothetical protein